MTVTENHQTVTNQIHKSTQNFEVSEHQQDIEHEHEATLYAEPVFHVGNFPVTNSLLSSWLALAIIVVISLAIRLKSKRYLGFSSH